MLLIDNLIMAPVWLFLLWLYWYSTPTQWPRLALFVDWAIAAIAVLGSLLILAWLHHSLDPSVEGLSRNVIAVVSAYLYLIFVLGAGWIRRFAVQRWQADH
jgi:quinol-cytochrome oxidoreductase complex cytochrome b subunit